MLKKILSLGLAVVLLAACQATPTSQASSVLPAPSSQVESTTAGSIPTSSTGSLLKIGGLKGPTSMGMAGLSQQGESYELQLFGSPDELIPLLLKGELDAAAIPCNLAAILHQKTKGALTIAAVNTLGVLYIVENGDSIHEVADLKGKTIYASGGGSVPEYTLRYILTQNGLDPDVDVTLEFKPEPSEVAALTAAKVGAVAMLPQPFVTAASTKAPQLRTALDLTQEWDACSKGESALVTGVLVVSQELASTRKAELDALLKDCKASATLVTTDLEKGSDLIAKLGILPKETAKKAIPHCSIVFIEGEEMITQVTGYLSVLYTLNPDSVGGHPPDEKLFYTK